MNNNTLTPKQLRTALDAWCEAQPKVIRFVDDPMFDPGWEARIWSPKCDVLSSEQGAGFHWDVVATVLENGGAITFDVKDFGLLGWLAIENAYTPWLELAASLPYTGSKAAQLALQAIRLNVAQIAPKTMGNIMEIKEAGE